METFGKLCRRAQYYKQITHGALSQASEHPRKCKYMKSEFMALEQIYNCDWILPQVGASDFGEAARKKVTFALPPGGPMCENAFSLLAEKTMFVCVCKFSPSL